MAIKEETLDPPAHWPSAEEVFSAVGESKLGILPEEVDHSGATPLAAFRREAQAIRVYAKQAGVEPLLLHPRSAEVVSYTEQAATWVLPTLVAAGLVIPCNIAADVITHFILEESRPEAVQPIVRFQEAYVQDGRLRVRQLEGPADELARLLRERGANETLPPLQEHLPEGVE